MKFTTLLSAAVLLSSTALVSAETLKWARAGDSLTLDPHAQNEGPTSTLAHQIMEPLVMRDHSGAIVPALATEWAPSTDNPNIWTFTLREGVMYHDGAAFTAEDVVFSLNRAMTPDSDYKELLASVKEVRAVGDYTIEIETDGPNPIMPNNRLCCTNQLRDSLYESSVVAGGYEQLVPYEVQDQELAFVQHGAKAARFAINLV